MVSPALSGVPCKPRARKPKATQGDEPGLAGDEL